MTSATLAWRLLRDGADRATIYLPLILTAALALGTYWLVRSAPKPQEPVANKEAPTHAPDYFMRGFVVKSFQPNGDLRNELFGKEGRHFPDSDTFEVDDVRFRSISDEGLVMHGSANRGLSNGDGTEIQLFGNAIVTRDAATIADGTVFPRLEFRGEFLDVFTDTERVKSHLPVVLTRGADRFTANSMDYDNATGIANLRGRVRGTLVPSSAPTRQ
jgi:lipopolysaccharide export system protein LptC